MILKAILPLLLVLHGSSATRCHHHGNGCPLRTVHEHPRPAASRCLWNNPTSRHLVALPLTALEGATEQALRLRDFFTSKLQQIGSAPDLYQLLRDAGDNLIRFEGSDQHRTNDDDSTNTITQDYRASVRDPSTKDDPSECPSFPCHTPDSEREDQSNNVPAAAGQLHDKSEIREGHGQNGVNFWSDYPETLEVLRNWLKEYGFNVHWPAGNQQPHLSVGDDSAETEDEKVYKEIVNEEGELVKRLEEQREKKRQIAERLEQQRRLRAQQEEAAQLKRQRELERLRREEERRERQRLEETVMEQLRMEQKAREEAHREEEKRLALQREQLHKQQKMLEEKNRQLEEQMKRHASEGRNMRAGGHAERDDFHGHAHTKRPENRHANNHNNRKMQNKESPARNVLHALQVPEGYSPQEIKITTVGATGHVNGKRLCGCQESCVIKEFSRSFPLKRGTDTKSLKARLFSDGQLTIEGDTHNFDVGFKDTDVRVEPVGLTNDFEDFRDRVECARRKSGIKTAKMDKNTGKTYTFDEYPNSHHHDHFETEKQDDGVTIEVVEE